MRKILLIIFIVLLFLTGCSNSNKEYITPENYYAELSASTYHSEREIKYNLKILKKNEDTKVIISNKKVNFYIHFNNGKCILINDKFPDDKITAVLPAIENLYKEINLDKFNGLKPVGPNTVEAYDSDFKYVLQYDKNNFAPQKLSIYKNNTIIKTFEYKNVELYKQ